tara:strand:- start:7236 stop:7820 length:585 start_codon:yes stop_codon:yes gene_type:complete
MIKFLKGALKNHNPTIENWDDPTKRIFNGQIIEGRPTKGFGTSSFNYAGKLYEPEPWTSQVKSVKRAAERIVLKELNKKVEFTFCLCGLYETGQIAIPHHSDTVPTLKDIVFSISFGEPRLFEWKKYNYYIKKRTTTSKTHILHGDKFTKTKLYLLEHGDCLIFDGDSQMTSTHAVPPIVGAGKRMNLTFRSGL